MFRGISVNRGFTYTSMLWVFLLVLVMGLGCAQVSALWIVVSALLSLCVAVPITLAVASSTDTSIRQVGVAANAIGQGKLSVALKDHDRKDELGKLNRSFGAIVNYLHDMAALSSAIAGGDLSVQIKPHSPDDALSHAFREMTEGLRRIVRSVRAAATQVATGADQVATASRETAQVSVQASSAIDELGSAMTEMSANVKSVAKNTQMQAASVTETSQAIDKMVSSFLSVASNVMILCDMSDRSKEEVRAGIAIAGKASDGLKHINASITSTAEIVTSLGGHADSIGNIVEVIDDIP